MKKKVVIFCFILSAFFVKETMAQVDLTSGGARYSIPLYNYSDPDSRIGTSVSLVYTAGNGLKVNEVASATGTGWALNAGGYIQRIQNGEPDDQKSYDTYTYPFLPQEDPNGAFWVWARDYYPNGFLHSEFTSADVITNRGVYTPMYPPPYYYFKPPKIFLADREQDMFKFSFNGREGFFIISRPNGAGVSEIRTLYDSKLKIEKTDGDLNNTQNIRTTISKFTITDESGTRYTFDQADLDQVCDYDQGSDYNASNGAFSNNVSQINSSTSNSVMRMTKGVPRNSFVKNRWCLTEISNPFTGVKITFEYETYFVDINTQKIIQRSIQGSNDRINITQQRSSSQVKRLKKIVLNNNETVEFEYFPPQRIDLPGDKSLSRINIKYANETKLKWDFTYGYFVKRDIKSPDYNFTTEDKVWARLCLLSLRKSSEFLKSEPPYIFDYYRGNEESLNSAVPPMFSAQQNLGGYYCTRFSGFYNPSNSSVNLTNPPYEPYGNTLLPKTLYQDYLQGLNYNPTLGYGNGVMNQRPTIEARNGVIKTVTNPMGGELKFDFEMNTVAAQKNFYGIRVSKVTEYDGISHTNDKITEYKYVKPDNSSSAWGYENFENKETIAVQVRQDCVSGIRPLLNVLSIARPIVNFMLGQIGLVPFSSTVVNIGGATIPVFVIVYAAFILYNLFDGFFGSNDPEYTTYNTDIYTSQLVNVNTLPFQYSRVEVISKLGAGDIGRTVHEFTSPASSVAYQVDVPAMTKPYANKQRCAYWIYGLPETTTVFDNNNNTIKKIVNSYNPIKTVLNTIPYQSRKWIPLQYEYGCGFNGWPAGDNSTSTKISSEIYYPMCGRIELTKTDEYTYNSNNEYAINTVEYEYNSSNYLPSNIKTTNSKGDLIEKKTYYTVDYGLSGAIQTLKDNNVVALPVSTQTHIKYNGSTDRYVIGGAVTEYGVQANSDVKPVKTYTLRIEQPVTDQMSQVSASALLPYSIFNTTSYKESSSTTYNTLGNAVQVNSENGKASVIYDYNSKLLVASVTNADHGDIAYTSFEADGTGGWTFDDDYIVQEASVTGKKCFKFPVAGALLSRNINAAKKYTLSFWTNGTPYVYGSAVTLLRNFTNSVTGYTYYEYEVTGGNSIKIDNNNNGTAGTPYAVFAIDELRLYPKEARMSTITYDPLFGKTSECDANGRIIYYEYDELGRLRFERDDHRNIVKMYEYNFKR